MEEVLSLVCLQIAAQKSIQMSLIWVKKNGLSQRKLKTEFEEEDCGHMGGGRIPIAEHDEGLRYLGFWIDACSDWGNQLIHLQEKARRFRAAVEPARLSPREVIYLYNAVLIPRITYCLTIAAPGTDDIERLESETWSWMAKKIGLAPNQARDLLHAPRARGGLGMESWHSVVLRRRANLAMQWREEGNEQMGAIYSKLREDHEEIKRGGAWEGLGWGSAQQGGVPEYWPSAVEPEMYCRGEWIEGLERSLAKEGWSWEDDRGILRWREGDQRQSSIRLKKEREVGFTQAAKSALWAKDCKWRSELVGPDGKTALPWGDIPGWAGWLPAKNNKTSMELRSVRNQEHAQQMIEADGWGTMGYWIHRMAAGVHDPGLGVGAWVMGKQPNGEEVIGKVQAWNWDLHQELRLKVDFWEGRWGIRKGGWSEDLGGRPNGGQRSNQ